MLSIYMTVHLLITGRVQRVSFRQTARMVAERLEVKGWARNLPEGHVEMMVSGEPDNIEEFVRWCHQGPALAYVDMVRVTDHPDTAFSGFSILR